MSLSLAQAKATHDEFKMNIARSGLTLDDLAKALGTTAAVIDQCIDMHPRRIDDNWILRNYLLDYLARHNIEAVPFSALVGDYHDYWFLNSKIISRGIID